MLFSKKLFLKIAFICVSLGLLFSGYLSAVKLFSNTCAFSEPCPYFLDYPACWYGFAMYLIMFIVTMFALNGKLNVYTAMKTNIIISFTGIIFAGNFAVPEILKSQVTGVLGFSTCMYGFIFYILIFIFSIFFFRAKE